MFSLARLGVAALPLLSSLSALAQKLPQVDLGYEIHQAISFNATGQLYNFSNIRYAQPPTGDLRFAAPVPPTGRNNVVQNGSVGRVCPQGIPYWSPIASEFTAYLLAGNASSFNFTAANDQLQITLQNAKPTPPDPRTSEDCLFLDVIVPKAVFDNKTGAPVIVWIYGGGYTLGSKGQWGNPSGLIKASQKDGSDGIIYVAMNYRLGALGWMAGPTFAASGGTPNAGLHDQRLAIEWVARYIHLFGGDPNQITLLGESAGGGSIVHQITAYGGQKGVSFQRAISQSPGFDPVPSAFTQENITNSFLSLLNVTTLDEARKKSSDEVITANSIQVGLSVYGTFTYGPMVDGDFVPNLPGVLLSTGQFAKNITVMVGHNTQEAPGFTPPNVRTNAEVGAWLRMMFPGIVQPVVDYITDTLYPPVYDGSQPYHSALERTLLMVQEAIFACSTSYLHKAFGNNTWSYEFQVPPGLHGADIQYTYYNGQGTNLTAGMIAPVAELLQGYLVNFAKKGNPNGPGLPFFPMQGKNSSMNAINATYVRQERDDMANQRCYWWQKGLYG
ncbi:uncharacterized protein Z518_10458 [Rhinocladiella mackenziei CBS 650.93]|uniref:Carboxylic ester hydrolase n=1 Tax=Rhinocladiella mackenziei CBS 650.93 TaxID=1442369 RepID=A0A0D2I3H1_9EURO|nr:uncharacterized protein Z518_10458 [Rhinocladiella mackenziei CBS 650.93]KIX00319.1 hypothetical protein Z518_10458 [Rhinocladiella mackenziei CBS 650.93]